MSKAPPELGELQRLSRKIVKLNGDVETAHARRRQLYLVLREAGLEHKVIAEAAGVTVPAVIQQCKIAARERAASPAVT